MGSKRGQNGVKRAILGVPQKGTFLTPDPKMDPNPEDPLFGVPPVLCHFWIGPCIKRSKPEKGHLSPYRDREMRGPKRGQNGGLGPGGLQARVRHLRGSTGLRLYPWDPRSLCKAGPLTQGPPEGSQKGSKWGPQKGQMGVLKTDTSGLEGSILGPGPTGHIVSNRGSQTDHLFGGTPKHP